MPRRGRLPTSGGFTLVEIIVSLLLVGILGTFTLFFLAEGIEGYFISQKAAESAFKAQIALDRVRLELIDIDSLPAAPSGSSIVYQSSNAELPGTRTLFFSAGTLYLGVDGTNYPLIDEVSAPTLSVETGNMDDDTSTEEVAYIKVGFTLGSQKPYNALVYPRKIIAKFW